ncbi:MAG: hypothetical protein ACAI25_11725 [Planctomycetota bacterium]
MRARGHLQLLVLGVAIWAAFWVAGLPDYYQQYSQTFLIVGTALLVPPTALAGWVGLERSKPERRRALGFWFAFYGTAPFLALDALYCGVHLGHGAAFFGKFWYLTVFYVLPWVLYVPMGLVLGKRDLSGREPSPKA